MMEAYAAQLVNFVKVHQIWAGPIVFALCFAESLAFISLLIPAWAALVAIGTLIAAGGLLDPPARLPASPGKPG